LLSDTAIWHQLLCVSCVRPLSCSIITTITIIIIIIMMVEPPGLSPCCWTIYRPLTIKSGMYTRFCSDKWTIVLLLLLLLLCQARGEVSLYHDLPGLATTSLVADLQTSGAAGGGAGGGGRRIGRRMGCHMTSW
jgi:hypothetical protein